MADAVIRIRRFSSPVPYAEGLCLQREAAAKLEKTTERKAELLLLEHRPVYTLGRRTAPEDLRGRETRELAARTGAEVIETDRGGSITYHGPGQVTAYLLLNIKAWGLTVHEHLYRLEEIGLGAARRFGLTASRRKGLTGVWVQTPAGNVAGPRPSPATGVCRAKVCAVGVAIRRWVTYHGLCLNAADDLSPFEMIIPCGLQGEAVTSLSRLTRRAVPFSEAAEAVAAACTEVFAARKVELSA